jgi:hypothetical protein
MQVKDRQVLQDNEQEDKPLSFRRALPDIIFLQGKGAAQAKSQPGLARRVGGGACPGLPDHCGGGGRAGVRLALAGQPAQGQGQGQGAAFWAQVEGQQPVPGLDQQGDRLVHRAPEQLQARQTPSAAQREHQQRPVRPARASLGQTQPAVRGQTTTQGNR